MKKNNDIKIIEELRRSGTIFEDPCPEMDSRIDLRSCSHNIRRQWFLFYYFLKRTLFTLQSYGCNAKGVFYWCQVPCNTILCPFTIVTLMSGSWYKDMLRVLKWSYHALIWPYHAMKWSYHALIRRFLLDASNDRFGFNRHSFHLFTAVNYCELVPLI